MEREKFQPSLSVEIEPPHIHTIELEHSEISKFSYLIRQMASSIDFISVTNRATFRLSSISTMKLISTVLRNSNHAAITSPVQHLTTRLSLHDTFNELLDARRLGIEYLLPVLGDPRGPKVSGFFNNSLELLTFIKGVTNPDLYSSLSNQIPSMKTVDVPYIEDGNFIVGSVIDPNEFKESVNGSKRRIRKQQIE